MRNPASYLKNHGPVDGPKLLRLLQQKSNLSSQIAKLKKRMTRQRAANQPNP
jgi:hypothetical protein